MNLNIAFKQMGPSDAIKFYVTEKSERLEKYFKGKISVSWNFSVTRDGHHAHCHLVGDHMDYFGEETTEDMHASIDLVVEKIERQLRKHKEIVRDHLHKHGHRVPGGNDGSGNEAAG
jgi:putative sigma-54 modulation protein